MVRDPQAPRSPQSSHALADELLAALDPLPYPSRMRELALRARVASAHGQLAGLLEELSERGGYERALAVTAAAVCGRTGYLERRLTDPDPVVRGHALKAARRGQLTDAALEAAFEDAPAAIRRQLARTVVAGRRTALADRLVEPLRERWGDAEAARLLPACGPETVARLLPDLFHAVTSWRALASRHPAAVLDEAERQLAALPEALRDDWWFRHAPCVALAAPAEPQRVLGLLEQLCHSALPLPVRHRLGTLAAAEPGRTIRLLLAPEHAGVLRGRGLERAVLRRLVRADPPELVDVARALGHDAQTLSRLLAALPPARRPDFFDAAVAERDLSRADVEPDLLEVLPRTRRVAEARRMAARARERGAHWTTVLESVAYLPVEEARDELLRAARRSSADDRALAYPLLVRNTARSGDPDAVTSLLALLERLRNEQDPVRSAALRALAETHPSLFLDAAAEHLDRIATDAIEARDSSPATRQALRLLAIALLREHAVTGRRELIGWALRTVTRLAGNVGRTDLGRLDHTLRRGQEQAVFEALRPWLEAGADRVDHELTFALARSLGRRAYAMPELQELLRQAIQFGSNTTVRTAVGLWLDDPARRDERVAELLALEPSVAVLPPVLAVLTHRRTDLLDVVLDDTPPYGRFLTPGSHWTPPVDHGTGRWLPRQRAAAARILARAAADGSLRTDQRTAAIAAAARIPDYGAEAALAWTDSDDVALTETALAALARTDRPGDHLPLLLTYAGGDRARVAVYAGTRASQYVAPSRLEGLLRGVLAPGEALAGAAGAAVDVRVAAGETRGAAAQAAPVAPAVPAKVTSRKEAARLAATRLPTADAAALLADVYDAPGQHHDVRAACVTFATGLLGHESVWELLSAAACGRRELRWAVLRNRPLDLPELHRVRYARLVRDACDTDDPEVASAGHAALATWSPWAPDAAAVLVAAATDLDDRACWQSAADALIDLMAAVPAGMPADNPLAWVLAALAAADAHPHAPDAEPDRDRPARRRIRRITGRLAWHSRTRPGSLRPVATAAAELLAGYEPFVADAAHVLVSAVDLDAEPGVLTAALARLARLHTTRPALAAHTADALQQRLRTAMRPGRSEALLRAAQELGDDGALASGLFAVTLTGVCGERGEWAEPWRTRLRALRRHPHPDVRDAALSLATAQE
ncbi:hypothetical protein SBI_02657 [Streptomyces bingchenggensis BCW-1]|uniref:Uncharacterized protein n=1 Tax=Streptomyces bingchenggensis (strain BCW-1) TaxID=749414 RepID=D7C0Q6_STRBB|nr:MULTISPECIES: hypothetical protein [Streptomyces]ADI05778.1 hypothetical protein SBI_02657 [Streptomyces bingchenggensis BCW-1]